MKLFLKQSINENVRVMLISEIYDIFYFKEIIPRVQDCSEIKYMKIGKWKEMRYILDSVSIRCYKSEFGQSWKIAVWDNETDRKSLTITKKKGVLYMCQIWSDTISFVINGENERDLVCDFLRVTTSNSLCVMVKSYRITMRAFMGETREEDQPCEVEVVQPWLTHVLLLLLNYNFTE